MGIYVYLKERERGIESCSVPLGMLDRVAYSQNSQGIGVEESGRRGLGKVWSWGVVSNIDREQHKK